MTKLICLQQALNSLPRKASGGEKPLAIDLFCGLGGWTEGLLAENYRVIGFDIERHEYGEHRYPAQLIVQDVLTLHGSQFKDAALIVASPPCQEYSYMAMPWKLAKAKAKAIRADTSGNMLADLTRLFNACFRIQREALFAAGRYIPLVVENVRGAQPWVGRARWNFGSFYLWGDVPALMPIGSAVKVPGMDWKPPDDPRHRRGQGFNTMADRASRRSPALGNGTRFTSRDCGIKIAEGRKGAGAGADWFDQNLCQLSSKSSHRKRASAMIAKIPLALSRHIAATYRSAAGAGAR
jgi:hypothetical protein